MRRGTPRMPVFAFSPSFQAGAPNRKLILYMAVPQVIINLVARFERNIAESDNEIDRLVYELYGLSKKEIKIVEGKV